MTVVLKKFSFIILSHKLLKIEINIKINIPLKLQKIHVK